VSIETLHADHVRPGTGPTARAPMRDDASSRHIFRVSIGLAILFAALVALRVHGFSFAAWHATLDGSQPDEVLLGTPREERWDDWMVLLPLALAQVAHDPAYPVENSDIGMGQNMLVPIPAPVWHPLMLFRPTFWGFFLGRDVGIAWLWWSQVLGLFSVWFLVFAVLTRGSASISVGGGALLLFAPLFQFYGFNAAPFAIWMGLAWLAAVGLLTASRPRALLLSGCLLGWSGACFVLVTYPPYQIPLAYLFLTLLGGFAWQRRRELALREALTARLLAGATALAIVAAASALLWIDAHDAIGRMMASEYPGQRVEVGGGIPLATLLNANLGIPLQVNDFGPLGPYVSSSAAFWITWPLIGAAMVWRAVTRRERMDPLAAMLLAYCAAVSIFCVRGVPEWAARLSLFSAVPASRAVLGLALADTLLLVVFLGRPRVPSTAARADAVVAVLWSLVLAASARELGRLLRETQATALIAFVGANGLIGIAILRRWRPVVPVSVAAAALAASTLWFNPVAIGGSEYILHNPVSKMIVDLDRRAGGRSTWIAYGDGYVSNLFRMLGVRSLAGALPAPQPDLWAQMDPEGKARAQYNRFAHVSFVLALSGQPFRSSVDSLWVELDPDDPMLERMGVTHLLVRTAENPRLAIRFAGYQPAGRAGRFTAYELPLRRLTAVPPASSGLAGPESRR